MHVLVSIAAKWQCISQFTFAVHVTESIFLNIITNSLYTSKHYIVVATDSGGTLKSSYEENICYT
jgi:dUTPase